MSQQSCFDSSYLEGKYLVTHTEFSGGGGIAMFHDEYPDGYLVRAKKLVNGMPGDLEIRFYQSGSFTAMIYPEDIKLCN
jgi:hypothetical protein